MDTQFARTVVVERVNLESISSRDDTDSLDLFVIDSAIRRAYHFRVANATRMSIVEKKSLGMFA